MFRALLLPALFLSSLAASAQPAPPPPVFGAHERWAAIGDSITHSGSYHQWVALYHLTRFPQHTLEFVNCGISGDTASRALVRFPWDIEPHQPTLATVMFGMNDVTRTLYSDSPATPDILAQRRERLQRYESSQRELAARLQAMGVRVVFITPSPFDQTADLPARKQTGVNDALAECTAFLHQLGLEMKIAVVDLHAPLTRLTERRQSTDPKFSLTRGDRIHPDAPGHFAMAYYFLKAQNAPAMVSRISIDGAAASIRSCEGGEIANLSKEGTGLRFVWKARALPFPLDDVVKPALDWVPFSEEFNQEILQVAGLPPGSHELRIDDRLAGAYSADQLSHGINLALNTQTPQYEQAQTVASLLGRRTRLVSADLRSLAYVEHRLGGNLPRPLSLEQMRPLVEKELEATKSQSAPSYNRQQAMAYLEKKARESESRAEAARLAAEAHAAAQPVARVYVLTRAR